MKINRVIAQGITVLLAGFGLAMLNSCGSGAVSADSNPALTFSISPSTATAYSGVPITFVFSGGGLRAPFLIVSSNNGVLPISSASLSATQIVITPGAVTSSQAVTLTVSDQAGKQAIATVTVQPNLINGDITITGSAPPGFPNCATVGAVCAGQSGTATLTISQNGAPARGRSVRFDVVQGNFQFPTDVAQTVFANSNTVTSDESGRAVVVIRANLGSSPQIATIRATDVASGAFRTATFFIKQTQINGGEFVTIPPEWAVNGAFKTACPAGSTDFLIFGGTPPYSIRSSAPGTASVFPAVTANENPSRFSTSYSAITCGAEGYQVNFTVTDANGLSILAKLTVKPGTADLVTPPTITLSPSSISLSCGQQAQVLVTINNAGATPPTITTSISTPQSPTTALTVSGTNTLSIARGNGVVGDATAPGDNVTLNRSAAITVGAGSAQPQTITVLTTKNCP